MYQNQSLQQNMAAAPKFGTVRPILKQKSRSFSSKKRRAKKCAPVASRVGFLNHSFSPLVNGYAKELNAASRVTESIFSAARNLCDLYGIKLSDDKHLIYPQNVSRLVEDLQEQIAATDKDANVLVISSEDRLPTLAVTKVFDTKTTLYYLPVEPLHFLMQHKERRTTGELLLSVLCYFYQIGGIPYFGENDSYLYYVYQMIYDWYSDEEICEDPKERQYMIDHTQLVESESSNLLKSLSDKDQLALLNDRLRQFDPNTKAEKFESYRHPCERIDREVFQSLYHGQHCR